jgi:hypothetical protein
MPREPITKQGGNMGTKGMKFSAKSRQRMSEAAKHRRKAKRLGGYNLLIAAVVKQAVKDRDVWFLETEKGKVYCAAAGIDPVKLMRGMA